MPHKASLTRRHCRRRVCCCRCCVCSAAKCDMNQIEAMQMATHSRRITHLPLAIRDSETNGKRRGYEIGSESKHESDNESEHKHKSEHHYEHKHDQVGAYIREQSIVTRRKPDRTPSTINDTNTIGTRILPSPMNTKKSTTTRTTPRHICLSVCQRVSREQRTDDRLLRTTTMEEIEQQEGTGNGEQRAEGREQ